VLPSFPCKTLDFFSFCSYFVDFLFFHSPALFFFFVLQLNGSGLHWFRLDDGVMGGQSETRHRVDTTSTADTTGGILHFEGTISTTGGGFASIRTAIPPLLAAPSGGGSEPVHGIRLRLRGDGKTYKFFLSDGRQNGPMSQRPSWQMDIPTANANNSISANGSGDDETSDRWEEVVVPFHRLLPSFGGGPRNQPADKSRYKFDANGMKEMGLMLSLKLSNGQPNPKETFGEGVFPFHLQVRSIETVVEAPPPSSATEDKEL
jgi:Complex I intermediate-associated protein 30 (CIA30)